MDYFYVKRKSVPKQKFTPEEDEQLKRLVEKFGENDWERVAAMLVNRNARQCHDRWKFYVNPALNKEPFTEQEDWLLINLVSKYGGMWVQISKHFKNRSDVQMKNRWKTLQKRIKSRVPAVTALPGCLCQLGHQQQTALNYIAHMPVVTKQETIPDEPFNITLESSIFGVDQNFLESSAAFFWCEYAAIYLSLLIILCLYWYIIVFTSFILRFYFEFYVKNKNQLSSLEYYFLKNSNVFLITPLYYLSLIYHLFIYQFIRFWNIILVNFFYFPQKKNFFFVFQTMICFEGGKLLIYKHFLSIK